MTIEDPTTMGGTKLKLLLVAKENMPKYWENIKGLLEETIEERGRELTVDGLFKELFEGTNQLWLYGGERVHGWAITSISNYPAVKRLRFILMGGFDMPSWLNQIDAIEQWAIKLGATEAEAWVRPGLRKKLSAFKYAHRYDVVTKKLEKKAVC